MLGFSREGRVVLILQSLKSHPGTAEAEILGGVSPPFPSFPEENASRMEKREGHGW